MRTAGFSYIRLNGRIVHYNLGAHGPRPEDTEGKDSKVRIQGVVSERTLEEWGGDS